MQVHINKIDWNEMTYHYSCNNNPNSIRSSRRDILIRHTIYAGQYCLWYADACACLSLHSHLLQPEVNIHVWGKDSCTLNLLYILFIIYHCYFTRNTLLENIRSLIIICWSRLIWRNCWIVLLWILLFVWFFFN